MDLPNPPSWSWAEKFVRLTMTMYDPDLWRHSSQVADWSYRFATYLQGLGTIAECAQWTPDVLEDIRRAGLLHDISKIYIGPSILWRIPYDHMTNAEKSIVHGHPTSSAIIAKSLPVNSRVADWVLYHHCLNQGAGIPAAACGKLQSVPLEAQVIEICDMMDALISDHYASRMTVEFALSHIRNKGRKHELHGAVTLEFTNAWNAGIFGL